MIHDLRDGKRPFSNLLSDEDVAYLADPKDIVAGTVINKRSKAPALELQAEPEFDARSSNIFKVLAAAGALATLADPGGNVGAAGQGLASGAASVNNQLVQGFLEKQEQAATINAELQQLNQDRSAEIEDQIAKAENERLLEDLRQKGRFDVIAAKFEADKAALLFERSLGLTEEEQREAGAKLRKIESEIAENEAQARAADALATFRLKKDEKNVSPRVVAQTKKEIAELERLLVQGKEVFPNRFSTESRIEKLSPKEIIDIGKRLQALYESFLPDEFKKDFEEMEIDFQAISDEDLMFVLSKSLKEE